MRSGRSNLKDHLSLPESGGLRLLLKIGLMAVVLALYFKAHFDAESICKALPKLLQQVMDAEGGDPGSVHWAPGAEKPCQWGKQVVS